MPRRYSFWKNRRKGYPSIVVAQKSAEKTNVVRKAKMPRGGKSSNNRSGNLWFRGDVTIKAPVRMYATTTAVCNKPIFHGETEGCLWNNVIDFSIRLRDVCTRYGLINPSEIAAWSCVCWMKLDGSPYGSLFGTSKLFRSKQL